MTVLLCVLALGCPARGGHAQAVPPPRGGHATATQIGDPGDVAVWRCIHNGEGAWSDDTGNGYYGGLQFNREFMDTYGRDMERKYGGYANLWSPRDQMIVAERARKTRGYAPWPQTRIPCGV